MPFRFTFACTTELPVVPRFAGIGAAEFTVGSSEADTRSSGLQWFMLFGACVFGFVFIDRDKMYVLHVHRQIQISTR